MNSIEERSRRDVEAVIRGLERRYGEFEIVEQTWDLPPERYRSAAERFERDALGGAGVWLTNEAGEVLLVRNEGDEGWCDPGGKVEPGESYAEAAKREVREETGLECEVTGVCDVHLIENRNAEADAPSVFEAIVIFRGDPVGGDLRPRPGEIADVGWFASPPADVRYEEVRTRPYPASR